MTGTLMRRISTDAIHSGIGLQMSSLLTLYVVAYENETRINVLIADIEVELNAKVSKRASRSTISFFLTCLRLGIDGW